MNESRLDYLSDPEVLTRDLSAVRGLLAADAQQEALAFLETITPRRYRKPRYGDGWFLEVETPNATSPGDGPNVIVDAYAEVLRGQQIIVRGMEMFLPGVDVMSYAAVPTRS